MTICDKCCDELGGTRGCKYPKLVILCCNCHTTWNKYKCSNCNILFNLGDVKISDLMLKDKVMKELLLYFERELTV